jgi:hypothetical protein
LGESTVSGPQEEWDQPDRSDQRGSRDATIDLARLVEGVQQQILVEQNGGGNGRRHGPKHSAALAQRPAPAMRSTEELPVPPLPREPGPSGALNGRLEADLLDGDPVASQILADQTRTPPAVQLASPLETDQQDSQPGRRTLPVPPGSLADLRQRLELLPFGHPSSPYHVDGERRPDPPRLKHLELAPPPVRSRLGHWTASTPASGLPARTGTAGYNQEALAAADAAAGSPDPQTAPWYAEEDDAFLWPDHTSPGVPDMAVALPAERGGEGSPVKLPTVIPRTEADGTWTLGSARLTRDQVRIADEAYDRFRAAEGRSLFGSYGSAGLTSMLRHLEEGLDFGRLAPDTEQRALLEPDAFRARFADQLKRNPDRLPEQLARRVPDALSYSFIFDAERYSAGIWIVQDAIAAQGFRLVTRRNGWTSTADKCVVTAWNDPLHDLPFQVQFHTSASLEAQHLAQTSASLISDPRIPRAEAVNLQADLAAAWAALPAPPGNSQIDDFDIDGETA